MHISVGDLSTSASDKGLSLDHHQAFILINAMILVIGPLGANFSDILIDFFIFSIKNAF